MLLLNNKSASSLNSKEMREAIKFEIVFLGEYIDAYMWVTGSHTDRARNALTEFQKRDSFVFDMMDFDEDLPDQGHSSYMQNISAAASRICGWSGIVDNKVNIPYSHEKALELLEDKDWLVPQVMYWSQKVDDYFQQCLEEAKVFASWQFKYSAKQKDGSTTQEHVDSVKNNPFAGAIQNQKKEVVELLEEEDKSPILPDMCVYGWSYFTKLHQKRQSGGMGLSCVTYSDIKAFFEINNIEPSWLDLELILLFDTAFLNQYYEDQEKERKSASKK